METKNLGLVKAIFRQSTSPSRTDVLWFDTVNLVLKVYDTASLSWLQLVGTDADIHKGENLLGYNFKAIPLVGPAISTTVAAFLSDKALYLEAIHITQQSTITGMKVYSSSGGGTVSYTENNFNGVGLYSLSGTTLTRVAISANDASKFKVPVSTLITFPFTAPYVAQPGIYYLASLVCWSAVSVIPTLVSYKNEENIFSQIDSPGNKVILGKAAQTSLPSTIDTVGLSNNFTPPAWWAY